MYLWEKGVAQNYGKGSNIPMIKAKNKDETDIACILMMARSEGLRFPMIRSRRCQAAHMINYLRCSISVQLIILTAAG